jgi:large subunit ribosomal protein L21
MKYAVVKSGGKQYRISEGDILEIEKIDQADKKDFIFENVLLITENGEVKVGNPFLTNVSVKASIVGETKGEKIRVSKYKAKVRYRRVTGHRQKYTKVKIEKIEAKGEKIPKTQDKKNKNIPLMQKKALGA